VGLLKQLNEEKVRQGTPETKSIALFHRKGREKSEEVNQRFGGSLHVFRPPPVLVRSKNVNWKQRFPSKRVWQKAQAVRPKIALRLKLRFFGSFLERRNQPGMMRRDSRAEKNPKAS
jgi:hypothetical protein